MRVVPSSPLPQSEQLLRILRSQIFFLPNLIFYLQKQTHIRTYEHAYILPITRGYRISAIADMYTHTHTHTHTLTLLVNSQVVAPQRGLWLAWYLDGFTSGCSLCSLSPSYLSLSFSYLCPSLFFSSSPSSTFTHSPSLISIIISPFSLSSLPFLYSLSLTQFPLCPSTFPSTSPSPPLHQLKQFSWKSQDVAAVGRRTDIADCREY